MSPVGSHVAADERVPSIYSWVVPSLPGRAQDGAGGDPLDAPPLLAQASVAAQHLPPAPDLDQRLRVMTRSTALAWSAFALGVALVLVDLFDVAANSATLRTQIGVDYHLYMDAATRWLQGRPYFQAYQISGPYPISAGDILYPPVALVLFVPFTALPAILWWLAPGAAVLWGLFRLRPARWTWPFLAICLAWPTTPLKILTGNPVMWAVAGLALGVVYAWPSVLVLIKPSLFPFALFGASRRSWWLALAVFAAVSLPFGWLWVDWVHSVLNAQGGGIAYSILEIPMLLFPVVAWFGRTGLGPPSG